MDRDGIVRVLRAFETAMGFHGLVRATEDVDLFIRATPENVDRLRTAFPVAYDNDPNIEQVSATDLLGESSAS